MIPTLLLSTLALAGVVLALVGLAPTTCWLRLDKRKKAGLIRGCYADIALELIGDFTKVIVTLSLVNHRNCDFDRFEDHVCKLDEVVECIATGGGTDYVMKVITLDLASFQTLMDTPALRTKQSEPQATFSCGRRVLRCIQVWM